ncbi:hypothetical protein J9B83_00265 [Marinomonas sp. A79]|uniref:Lipoprotein n=1 Tax=Marinomonas vulgaris TaxID=2823372 RepID=A0ABS5H7D5_9GAMM|nr:hypothetical protein [Marinomonas vulgaris]MBR7887355.1 hypothetical protein [Marinomonas vulgaris]
MKLGVGVFLGLLLTGCSLFSEPVIQESYFLPVIQSDVTTGGYTPSVTPVAPQIRRVDRPTIYTPLPR